jgi:AcrR family transcriptional regulator
MICFMGRWAPDAKGRIAQAAMELYGRRGYDRTTVAEIAERAGVTERTFFRHFADKREVLFPAAGPLQDLMVTAVSGAPASAAPLDAVMAGINAWAAALNDREFARQRQAIVASSEELRERDLIKMATLSSAIADALRKRGVKEPTASLTAETGIAVFKVAFLRWVDLANRKALPKLIAESLEELKIAIRPSAG